MMANKIALSFDVEDWYHTPLITGSPFAKFPTTLELFKTWDARYDYITEPTMKILSLLEKYNIRATFFMIGDSLKMYPEIVTALQSSDHEIACHGYYHHAAIHPKTKVQLISTTTWRQEVQEARELLEHTFNRKVTGYRAPGAYFGVWMIQELTNLGFHYDSSIAQNSFYNKTDVVLRDIPQHPYWVNGEDLSVDQDKELIVELPWSNYKFLNMSLPVGGAYFFRLLGLKYFIHALENNLKTGDTMFYLHPYDLAYDRMPMSNFRHRPFFWINQGLKSEKRLDKLLDKFKEHFTTCDAVYNKFLNGRD